MPVEEKLRDSLSDGVAECEGVEETEGVLLGVAEAEGTCDELLVTEHVTELEPVDEEDGVADRDRDGLSICPTTRVANAAPSSSSTAAAWLP